MGAKRAEAVAAAIGAAGLTDTDILIDAARGMADAVAFLTAQQAAAGGCFGHPAAQKSLNEGRMAIRPYVPRRSASISPISFGTAALRTS